MKSVNEETCKELAVILLNNAHEIQSQLSIFNTTRNESTAKFIELLLTAQNSNMALYKLLNTEVAQDEDIIDLASAYNDISNDIHATMLSETQKRMVMDIVERYLCE